jgi:hypothetical protein
MGRQFLGLIGTSFGLIALYLVLTNAAGSAGVINALGGTYVGAVKALQGR